MFEAITAEDPFRNPTVDLESPIFAQTHLFPLITAHVKVVPEKSVSIEISIKYYKSSA